MAAMMNVNAAYYMGTNGLVLNGIPVNGFDGYHEKHFYRETPCAAESALYIRPEDYMQHQIFNQVDRFRRIHVTRNDSSSDLSSCCSVDFEDGSGDELRRLSEDKKRQDRNSREQQRSFRISQQIDILKALLNESGIKVKNSKFGILSGVADYLKNLTEETQRLEEEFKRLQEGSSEKPPQSGIPTVDPSFSFPHVTEVPKHVNVFFNAISPLAVASIDGRFIECNDVFLEATKWTKEQLMSSALFKLVEASSLQSAYIRIGEILQKNSPSTNIVSETSSVAASSAPSTARSGVSTVTRETSGGAVDTSKAAAPSSPLRGKHGASSPKRSLSPVPDSMVPPPLDHFFVRSTISMPDSDEHVFLGVSLIRDDNNSPKYFSIALVPGGEIW